jgi:cell wall-associated NlpC family hydrolase
VQVDALDAQVAEINEQLRSEQALLAELDRNLASTRLSLAAARHDYGVAMNRLQARIVAIYTKGEPDAPLTMLLSGSVSIDKVLDQADAAHRISKQDQEILLQVKAARAKLAQRKKELAGKVTERRRIVRRVQVRHDRAQSILNKRQAVLNSVSAKIRKIMEERRAAAARAAAARSRELARESVGTDTTADVGGSADPLAGVVAPPAGPGGSGAVSVAMRYIGTPYVWGGSSPSGFDCSGLTSYSYAQVGISIPRTSYGQWGAGPHVARDDLQPGDLVFFNGLGHVGMYVGGGNFIHAPHTGDVVRIESLSGWYASSYVGAVRVA